MQEGQSCLAASDVFCNALAGCCRAGFRGDVRRDRDLRVRPKGMICRHWLCSENVQSGMGDLPGVERAEKGGIVDQRAASRIDDEGAFRHEAEAVRVEKILGFGGRGKQ